MPDEAGPGSVPGLLDSYSPERSGVGDQVLRNAGAMTKAAILRNPILQEIRNLRPDAYVAASTPAGDASAIVAALGRIAGGR